MCPPEENWRNVRIRANYAEAISRAGHLPVVVPRFGSDVQFDETLALLDVLVMTGGEDVAPARYGEKESPKLGKVNLLRDEFDLRLVAAARRRNLPIVGICRGCQLLNVEFGGTLWQDLPSEFPVKDIAHRGSRHAMSILPDSRLAQVLGKTNVVVNSYHHQAVKDVAPGFRVTAVAPDGVAEVIESDSYPAIGVQFHPERLVVTDDDELFTKFFEDLLYLFDVKSRKVK